MRGKSGTGILILSFCAVVLLYAGLTTATTISASGRVHTAKAFYGDKTVIIDPGHGGPDGGAVGTDGVVEKGINLSISLKLRSFFTAAGYQVIMTREDDRTICDSGCKTIRSMKASDLHNRLKIANDHPDALFISIHQNIYESSAYSGAQVFYSPKNPESKTLADTLQAEIRNNLQPQNTRVIKPAQDNLYILYYTKSPAVMVECGFLSNPQECRQLEDDGYQNQMAFSIFSGVLKYYSHPDAGGQT